MIDRQFAEEFARKWIEAFNSHELAQVFELYEDDFVMESPYIRERMGVASGQLIGKSAVRPYWEKSLALSPPLVFSLIEVFVGVSSVVIYYESVGRRTVCETFEFSEKGKVCRGCSQHGPAADA